MRKIAHAGRKTILHLTPARAHALRRYPRSTSLPWAMSSLLLPREAILSLLLLLVVTTRAHAATPAAVFDDIKTRAPPDEL